MDAEHVALRARKSYRNVERRSDLDPRRWLRISGEPLFDDAGTFMGFRTATTDITELKKAQEHLEESEQRFRDFASSGSDWLWETDAEFRFTEISGPIEDSGRDQSNRIGKTRWDISADDDTDDKKWRAHKADLAAHRPFRDFHYSGFGRDGSILFGKASGVPVFGEDGEFMGYRGTGSDVTDIVKAENARKESEARFRDMLETSPIGAVVVEHTIVDGQTVARRLIANGTLVQMFGFEPQERLLETGISDSWVDQEELLEANRIMKSGGDLNNFEALRRRLDGTEWWVSMTSRPFQFDGRSCTAVWHTDITGRKDAEANLRQSQKMEAIGQLTGGIAHDFNNLLAVMMGNLAILEEELGPSDLSTEFLAPTLRAVEKAASLTSYLLAFSRQQPLLPRHVDVNELLRGMRPLIKSSLVEEIEIEFDLAAELDDCRIDPGQLEQAVLNLSINARDAMPDGGHLDIRTANIQFAPDDERPEGMLPGRYVMITACDDGVGIPSENLERLFEPFFTTKDVGKGTGLGLSMVYGFVKQSEGHITVSSTEGSGATFRIYLQATETSVK